VNQAAVRRVRRAPRPVRGTGGAPATFSGTPDEAAAPTGAPRPRPGADASGRTAERAGPSAAEPAADAVRRPRSGDPGEPFGPRNARTAATPVPPDGPTGSQRPFRIPDR